MKAAHQRLTAAIREARHQYTADADTARLERDAAIARAYADYAKFAESNTERK